MIIVTVLLDTYTSQQGLTLSSDASSLPGLLALRPVSEARLCVYRLFLFLTRGFTGLVLIVVVRDEVSHELWML